MRKVIVVPNQTKFICSFQKITELDLSNCPNLTHLDCHNNQITELDLSNCPNLTELWCDKNQITELDVSQNDKLVKIKGFDYGVHQNIKQYRLWCQENFTYKQQYILK